MNYFPQITQITQIFFGWLGASVSSRWLSSRLVLLIGLELFPTDYTDYTDLFWAMPVFQGGVFIKGYGFKGI